MWKFWWQTFHDFADQGTSENVNYVVEFSDELCQNEWETGDYSWLLDGLWWGGDVTQTHLHCPRVQVCISRASCSCARCRSSSPFSCSTFTIAHRTCTSCRAGSVIISLMPNLQGCRGDGISIPIPIPYPQKVLQDPHTHRTPKSYIPVPAPRLFTTRAPLKLWPYGTIQICLLLLLFFWPSVDMFPREFKN